MAKNIQSYVIHRPEQMAVLAAAARQEIVDVLAPMGNVSVAEVAAALGRPADALYYHLRALQRSGLVLAAGYRYKGARREALFRTVSPELRLRYQPRSASNRKAVTAIVGSMLRLGIRDFRRAFQSDAMVEGERRELWALRRTGWLSLAQIAKVNRHIQRLAFSVAEPKGRGRLYGITVLLTPLDHRSRKGRASSRGKKSK